MAQRSTLSVRLSVNAALTSLLLYTPKRSLHAMLDGILDGETARTITDYQGQDAAWYAVGRGLGLARNAIHTLTNKPIQPPYHPRTTPKP